MEPVAWRGLRPVARVAEWDEQPGQWNSPAQ